MMNAIDIAEPVFFCDVLEYVAYRAASRSVRKLKSSIEKKAVLQEFLQEMLNEDLSATILGTTGE